jgi:FAD/FMN-containing dehydrogenase
MSSKKVDSGKRQLLLGSAGLGATVVSGLLSSKAVHATTAQYRDAPVAPLARRVRPGEPGWPTQAQWQALAESMQGKVFKVPDPFAGCEQSAQACNDILKQFENPFFIQDTPGATQSSGWVDAWTSRVSPYAAEVETAQDVSKAVQFAKQHNLRLVVKGGAHSYLGQSNAVDSFLVWTKRLNQIDMHQRFVPEGSQGVDPFEAVSVAGGAIWVDVYDKVVVKGKRYVQGGGCTSVGVGGHLQTGGFGSFSKRFGMSAGGIVEVEMVLADGSIVVANEHQNPDLFWAVRGAGAAFGIITRATLKLHPLPDTFGFAGLRVKAKTDGGYTLLVQAFLRFYRDELMNPHWGEHAGFNRENVLEVAMSIQGLSEEQAAAVWRPFVDWVLARPNEFDVVSPLRLVVIPAYHWWDYDYRKKHLPKSIVEDTRPNGKAGAFWWSGSAREVSIYIAGYESGWLHERLLQDDRLSTLAMTLVAASHVRAFEIHFNKGLAGSPPEVARQGQALPINPVVEHAFGLVIIAGGELNVHEGLRGHEPDKAAARAESARITEAMNIIRAIAPDAGGYSSEMSYFAPNWQADAWGSANYARLLKLKHQYDPDGVFMAHHYVGSEQWDSDGFVKRG